MLPRLVRDTLRSGYRALHPHGVTVRVNGEPLTLSAMVARGVSPTVRPPLLAPWLEAVRDADVVFDIGAGVGLWSAITARARRSTALILAIEPAPASFRILTCLCSRSIRSSTGASSFRAR